MKIFVVALFFVACASAGVLKTSRPTIVTLLDYYKNNKDEARIIDGKPASPGQFPWQAAVTKIYPEGRRALCGGSLIASRWVITAAHCVIGGVSFSVKLGGINRIGADEPGSVTISSRNAIPHENYNNQYLYNDIGLIELAEDVEFTDTIQPIRLPSRSEVSDRLENRTVTVSGYGKTSDAGGASDTLNFVELTTITNRECADFYGSEAIIDSTICARGNPHHSTCSGDSGGPLIITGEDGQPTIIGVVSFSSSAGCASGAPSGYVRTASFLDWISEKTGIEIRD